MTAPPYLKHIRAQRRARAIAAVFLATVVGGVFAVLALAGTALFGGGAS